MTDQNGDDINVTLTKLIDPAQGADEFNTPNAGSRFVGAVFTIKANAAYDGNANNSASVVGTNGQSYTADFSNIAGYANFNSGAVNLAPGESSTGAVVFQVPTGVGVAKVAYDPANGMGSGPVVK